MSVRCDSSRKPTNGVRHQCVFQAVSGELRIDGSDRTSSRFLGNALARYVGVSETPLRILEVGPGTGAVTRSILRKVRANDQLDLVELNDQFVQVLQDKFATQGPFNKHANQVSIIHDRVEAMVDREPYDVIVSGLPLNNFDPDVIRSILSTFEKLLKKGGNIELL